MRLLILSDGDNPHTIKWIQALADRGHDIVLFSLQEVRTDAYAGLARVRVRSLGLTRDLVRSKEAGLRKLRYLRAVPTVRSLAREFNPDLVHAHYASSYGLVAHLSNLRPRIVSAWGGDVYTAAEKSWAHRFIIRHVLKRADTVLSTSHVMGKQVARLADRDPIITPFGVDTHLFTPRPLGRPSHVVTIGIVKSLEAKYGVDLLIQAYAQVRRSTDVQMKLLIVGDGSMRERLGELAKSVGVEDEVTFAGRVAPDRVIEFHQAMDIGVYPSIEESESFGVSIVEAQACAVPVVVSRVGGLPEVVVDGLTGVVVESRNIDALASAIQRLVEDEGLRSRMGNAGRQHVLSTYDLSDSLATMERAYVQTVRPGPHSKAQDLMRAK